jgi:RNA polymerase sigma-70 factor (ECF subfamily)
MGTEFEQWVTRHSARIRHIARRYAAPGAVDDLVQDILVRLWRSFPHFRSEAKVETWIYRVALNAAMTHVKGAIRERTAQEAIAAQSQVLPAAHETTSMGDILAAFLGQLGDIDASILMMYLDGLSADEISTVLGISANVVAVRINRLKHKFSATYVE